MFQTILCPIDGSDHARKALDLAIDMASKNDSRLVLVHTLLRRDPEDLKHFAEVEGLSDKLSPELVHIQAADSIVDRGRPFNEPISGQVLANIGESILKAAERDAEARGVHEVTPLMTNGDPARRILEYADREQADCIVMGNRGLSDVKALFLGSVSHKVNNEASCTCITVK